MEGLIEGRIVHFVAEDESHRAAIVASVGPEGTRSAGLVHLQVFSPTIHGSSLVRDVKHSPEPRPGTWHWIERA